MRLASQAVAESDAPLAASSRFKTTLCFEPSCTASAPLSVFFEMGYLLLRKATSLPEIMILGVFWIRFSGGARGCRSRVKRLS